MVKYVCVLRRSGAVQLFVWRTVDNEPHELNIVNEKEKGGKSGKKKGEE
jgi:hypothetical protein